MTVVVTGANGHLGSNLVQRLLQDGEAVRATVHRRDDALRRLGVDQVAADVLEPASLRKAFDGASTVFHLAAKISIHGDRDGLVHRTNVEGTAHVARAARNAGVRLVHVSSVHAFDLARCREPLDESQARSGARCYAYDHSKAQGEQRIQEEVAKGLDATRINPTGIIGPMDLAPSRMGQVFLDLRARRLPALVAGAFDFVDVRDVARSVVAARERGATGECYLLAGHHVSMPELARVAQDATGVPAPRRVLPLWLATASVPLARLFGRGDPRFTFESIGALRHGVKVDDRKARHVLGHRTRSLQETVSDLYAWFEEVGL